MPICWEEIYNDWEDPGSVRTFRAEVHGGWLVKDWSYDYCTEPPRHEEPDSLPYISSTMVFVPDPNHEWVISEEVTCCNHYWIPEPVEYTVESNPIPNPPPLTKSKCKYCGVTND